jgi:monovalent cation:H+ antiporter, CPA1 family
MILTLLMVTAILYLALQLEERLKVPSPLGLIALSFAAHYGFEQAPILTGAPIRFAALVVLLLPILLISDSLELKLADLKKHGISLIYLAVAAVVLSLVIALNFSAWLFPGYELSTAAVILLFAMVLATDPVSVVSIFSKFELPHQLKLLAEGESLFNDATALIVFVFIGLFALGGGELSVVYIGEVSVKVVLGSIAVGMLIGFVGLLAMKSTANRVAEMMVLIMSGYGAFELAEHFYSLLNLFGMNSHLHLSGILACIFATITVNHVMTQAIADEGERINVDETEIQAEAQHRNSSVRLIGNALGRIKATVAERGRHLRTKEDVQLLAMVANTILFVAMAEMIDTQLLWKYRAEILVMFLATTLIRGVMMALFAWIARKTDAMISIRFHWWSVLTFAGIKGGLSIVMLTMIPSSFPYLEMFTAVVIGVILLSTFIYSGILLFVINRYSKQFLLEKNAEHS